MKLALLYNLIKYTRLYINLEKYVIIWTLFEFIRAEGGG
jgi:hypothetical protein